MNGNPDVLISMLLQAGTRIDETARYLSDHPDDETARLNLSALRAAAERLRVNLGELLADSGGVLVDYRLYTVEERDDATRSVAVVGASYQAFQKAFSAVYDAIEQGPRSKSRKVQGGPNASRLFIAGLYEGSFGSTFYTGSRSSLVTFDSLEAVMEVFRAFVGADAPERLRAISAQYGMDCARKLAQWVKGQQDSNVAVSASLRVGQSAVSSFDLSPSRLESLGVVMALSSEVRSDFETRQGTLVAVDVHNRRFTLDGRPLTGFISGEIDVPPGYVPFAVPSVGRAFLAWTEEDRLLEEAPTRRYRLLSWEASENEGPRLVIRSEALVAEERKPLERFNPPPEDPSP